MLVSLHKLVRLVAVSTLWISSTQAAHAVDLPVPLKDVNTVTGGATFKLGAEMGGHFYYGACEQRFGCELYRTPIGGSGAELVRDIHPNGSSNPEGFVNAGGTLFFRAFGDTLYKSDGTEEGTKSVHFFSELSLGAGEEMVALGNQVIFKAQHSMIPGDVWVSDGTTTTAFDICTTGSCDVFFFTVAGNRVFFVADDGSGRDLWKYESGSVTQVDVNPSGAALPGNLNAFGNDLIFQANVSELGLWISDGTTNTKIAGSAQSFFGLFEMVVAGGLAYFDGCCASGQGRELWVSNGTTGGTFPIKDIQPGTGGSEPQQLTAVGSSVFFTADDGTGGRELWISILADPDTTLPLELVPGAGQPSFLGSLTDRNGGQLVFIADDGTGFGREPWVSDGTPGGTTMLGDLAPGPADGIGEPLVAAAGSVYYPSSALDSGDELWRTDGTLALKLTELDTATAGSDIDRIATLGGLGYFCAYEGETVGTELWRTDGTTAGTFRLEDIAPPAGQRGCDEDTGPVVAGGTVFFVGHDGGSWGLWATSGGVGGAVLLESFAGKPSRLTEHAGLLFFAANDGGGAGTELWRSNGTAGGTFLVEDIYPGSVSSSPSDLASAGGLLYFTARYWSGGNNTADLEPFRSDGTAAGTGLLKDIRSGTTGSFPGNYAEVAGKVVFTADDGNDGEELWVTDGSLGGTVLLKDIRTGAASGASGVQGFTVLGTHAYFVGNDGSTGFELWRTDGTAGGTSLVEDIRLGGSSSSPQELGVAGSRLYFSADDGVDGREPWVTDGSTTTQLADANPSGSSNPRHFFPTGTGDGAYFSANKGDGGGAELWGTDGTPGGTGQVAELHPDDAGNPEAFSNLGSTIVFTAYAGISGQELWTFGEADCGDAPAPYPTLLVDAGPCHRIAENTLKLASQRDADPDGQPTSAADGDDTDGLDDEEGVSFTSSFALGGEATFDVSLSDAGFLNAWFDWNSDGDWDDVDEHAIFRRPLAAGVHALAVSVPDDAPTGTTFARFRVDSTGSFYVGGVLFDGEVEDHEIVVVEELDFGDAPDPVVATAGEYPTLLANDGARHRVVPGIYLGSGVDSESDGQPTASADGDDDDDGVAFTTALEPGMGASVDVTTSTSGTVYGWFDWNADGVWNDSDEQVIDGASVGAGVNTLGFTVPAGAQTGVTYARFRFDTDGDAYEPTGHVDDGEVEDYLVQVGAAADLAVSKSAPATAIPGATIGYTIVASNAGPGSALAAAVSDAFPVELSGCTWACVGAAGGVCAASGAGDLAESVNLPSGASVTFSVTCDVGADETGTVNNTATVAPPVGLFDPNGANNSSMASTTLTPTADLAISKTDGTNLIVPPASLTYTIQVQNLGPSDVLDAQVADTFPALFTSASWTCAGSSGGSCAASGSGDLSELVDLPAGSAVTFSATGDVDDGAPGTLANTATVSPPAGVADPVAANDSATDETELTTTADLIFLDGFESGDTSQWDTTVGDLQPLLGGVRLDDLEIGLQLDAAALERSGRATVRLVTGYGPDLAQTFELVLETKDGRFRLLPRVAGLDGAWIEGTAPWLDGVPETIDLVWSRGLAGGDGHLLVFQGSALVGSMDEAGVSPLAGLKGHRVGSLEVVTRR